MKNIITLKYIMGLFLIVLSLGLFTGCEEDEDPALPIVERVSLVPKDSTTEIGYRGNTYVIFGQNLASTQQVYFNGQLAPLNPVFVRNDNIIVQIANSTPYVQGLNKLRVVTAYGEAVLDFTIHQKAVINSFSPAVAAAGETVTILGNYFDGLESVKFVDAKTGEGIEAEVIQASVDKLKVIVPEGVKVSYIAVTTPSGTVVSASSFGFNYVLYADKLASPWENWSWSSVMDFESTQVVKSGNYSLKQTYTGGWGGIQLGNNSPIPLADYTAFKMSIYGGPGTEGKEIMVFIGWAKEYRITLKEGVWTDFTIPLTDLGSPAEGGVVVLQDVGNVGVVAPYLIYIDDVGFI